VADDVDTPRRREEPGTEFVHDRLREAILRGELEIDTPISQVKLAQRLGVSRTPLREAVRMLQREGLILSERNRQVRVAPLSVNDLEELYAHRLVIEALTLRLSVPRFDETDFEEMTDYLAEMHRVEREQTLERRLEDLELWETPHRAFHEALRKRAGPRLARDASILYDHSERYRRVYLADPGAWRRAGQEHEAILEACRNRDSERASELLARHLARTALTVIASLAPEHDPAPVRVALQLVVGPLPADPARRP
jgi:DNA-binding GntR family transcriptional regulator